MYKRHLDNLYAKQNLQTKTLIAFPSSIFTQKCGTVLLTRTYKVLSCGHAVEFSVDGVVLLRIEFYFFFRE